MSKLVRSVVGVLVIVGAVAQPTRGEGDAAAPAAAAVVPDRITFKRVEIHDVGMDDRVSHTMYVPEGWNFEGRTEWSEGAIVFPQENIEVRSPDGYRVRFVPALHLAYSDIDPNFAMQLRQNGLWNPQVHHESQGIKPPDDIGEFIVGYITRNNKAVSRVRLVSQKRDRDAEAAVRDKNPGAAGDTGEFHVINIEYERDGAAIREEISLIYGKGQPMRFPTGTSWPYTIVTNSMVSGPAEGFAQAKPLLYSIASSLSATPEWYYASRQVLSEIQAARHQQNMAGIRRWGDAIRKAGEENSKLSDARLKQWKDDQKVDDEKQRDRVRRIYDIYTCTTPDGGKLAVPLGLTHVYRTNDGKFIASRQAIANNPNLTPVPTN
jgi:hypothetical protein